MVSFPLGTKIFAALVTLHALNDLLAVGHVIVNRTQTIERRMYHCRGTVPDQWGSKRL